MKVTVESSATRFEDAARQALEELMTSLRAVQRNQEIIMTLTDQLTYIATRVSSLEQQARDHDAQMSDLALTLEALDANLRAIADSIGGLERTLTPGTAIGRLVRRMLQGEQGDPDASHRSQ